MVCKLLVLKLSIYCGIYQVINNLNLYSAVLNNNSTVAQKNTAEIEAISKKHADSSVENEKPASIDNNIYLSNRAQKTSAISSEFFSGAPLTFDGLEKLKEKLYQFGLISKDAYSALTHSNVGDKKTEVSDASEKNPMITLTSFIGDFIERLNKEDAEDETKEIKDDSATESKTIIALTGALNAAKKILTNVEEQKVQTDFKTTLKDALVVLKEVTNDQSFEKLPIDDRVGLSKVYQALEIVDRLSPQRLNNNKVNQYLKLSFR
jgi:hypothetical protein